MIREKNTSKFSIKKQQ